MSIPNATDCRHLGITIFIKSCDLDLKRPKRENVMQTPICYCGNL